ncbi:GGDEF domain-containing protein [Niveibacterium sp.]|uniref:GGDEF domain-containing protein n=1 Tax=Niveibacterium sp. TaxID=2017444 RepID=UPI0035B198AB
MTALQSPALYKLERLLRLARELMQAAGREGVFELVGAAMRELFEPDRALMMAPVGDAVLAREFDASGVPRIKDGDPLLHFCAQRAIEQGRAQLDPPVPDDVRARAALDAPFQLCAVPFPAIEPSGVICLLWRRRRIGRSKELAALRHIGELATAALINATLRDQLECRIREGSESADRLDRAHEAELTRRNQSERLLHRLSVTDVMTGLLNRRGFDFYAQQSLVLARQQCLPGLLLFADINGLKQVNDELGHEQGDELIQDCAGILREAFRKSDVVARLGGDEFAVFSIDDELPDGVRERVQQRVARFVAEHPRPYPVSMSLGIVHSPSGSEQPLAALVAEADALMYAQKRLSHAVRGARDPQRGR